MIPLRDSTPSEQFPLITVILIAVNTLIFYYETTLGPAGLDQFAYIFGLVPANVTHHSGGLPFLLPFITSTFLHGSWMHLIGNMWVLWLFGDNVEDRMGSWNFLGFYLFCGLVASITHFAFNLSSTVPVVGASGAVAGVMGAYFLMFRQAKILTLIFPFFLFNIPAWIYLGVWAGSQLFAGATGLLTAGVDQGIAFWAHIGGFAFGMIIYQSFLLPARSKG